MAVKLTEEQALSRLTIRLEGSGLAFMGFEDGRYVNAKGRITIHCTHHGVFGISYDKLISGTGCRKCADARLSVSKKSPEDALTSELIAACTEQGLVFKGFEFGVFASVDGRAEVECKKHGVFFRRIADLKSRKYKCPSCSSEDIRVKNRLPEADAVARWSKSCADKGLTFLGFETDYLSADATKAIIKCNTHGNWVAGYSSFVLAGAGCPSCNRRGFRPLAKAYLYALSSGNDIKIGVTNNPRVRLSTLKNRTPFPFELVELVKFSTGLNAITAERYFHDKYESSGFSGFDGASEWLKFDQRILEEMRAF